VSTPTSTTTSTPEAARPWWRDAVFYQVYIRSFADGDGDGIGDLAGIRSRLPYLHDLGVTAIWLTPIWKNTDSDYHGYHVVDFYATDDHMGTMSEYQALVADAHKLDIKVLLDYVVDHTGPNHPWASDPPTTTWLHGSPQHHLEPSYKFNGLVDPHATPDLHRV
jgi:alpha-glucosidase